MSETGIHISLSAEPVFSVGNFLVTNSMFTSVVVSLLLITFALIVNRSLKRTDKPKGIQNFAEWLVESLYNLVYSVTGNLKKTSLFFPLIATFFIFILLNNWVGLLPGFGTIHVPAIRGIEESVPLFRAGTADINATLALGIISVLFVQVFGFKSQSFGYFKKFFNFSSPIMFFVGILELISEFSKVISFTFRLFGNIFAGEVLLVVITSLTKVVGPIPFYGLEVFVGFIQALVFAMLSLVLFNMASMSHDEH